MGIDCSQKPMTVIYRGHLNKKDARIFLFYLTELAYLFENVNSDAYLGMYIWNIMHYLQFRLMFHNQVLNNKEKLVYI